MKKVLLAAFIGTLIASVFSSCKKESEELDTGTLQEYFPLQAGNVWVYRIDSIMPFNFGAVLIEKPYHAKDSVTGSFIDNEGRTSFTIWRYIRDTAARTPWRYATTITATVTDKWVEYVENNLRFVKLSEPVREGYSWQAHSFIDTRNSNFAYLDRSHGWNYTYTQKDQPSTVNGKFYESTVTVEQVDETTPPGPFDPNVFKQRLFGKEVYAKGVGLISKEILFWTWQAAPPSGGGMGHYEDGSFGLRLTLISHR